MSPEKAIRAATLDTASYLGRPELGTLSSGAVADLVLVRGNPLEAIPMKPEIVMTVHNGRIYRPKDLLAREEGSLHDEPWARQFKQQWEHQQRR